MRLTELEPRWWGEGTRILGVSFRCPHCQTVRLGVAFANPPDGGGPSAIVGVTMPHAIRDLIHVTREFDVPPGHLWQRTGDTFESMTLAPSIDASKAGHWHGNVTNGEVN